MQRTGSRILVVEDEVSIGQGLCDVLTYRGHEVTWSKDGESAVQSALSQPVDLVLLDVMLPEIDGFTVCKQIRASGNTAGIIVLTAKGSEEDILHGFKLGADDYVTKPFSLKLLLARVDALLGRSRPDVIRAFSAGGLVVDPSSAQGSGDRGMAEFSAKELGVLRALMSEPGRIISRRALLRDVWEMPNPDAVETRTVDVHMGKLRKKLGTVCADSIQTVRGQGYRFVPGGAP